MDKRIALLLAGSTVVAAQVVGGLRSPTSAQPATAAWYARLRKPSFTPPGPVFGVAWTCLDALLGYAGYRLLTRPASRARALALGLWGINVAAVAGYSWVMFGRKRLDEATGVTVGMLASSVGAVAAASQVDKRAALASIPLAAWVSFACVLQEEIWRRNA
jgi:translocator protein